MNLRSLLFIFIFSHFYHMKVSGKNILVVMPMCFPSHLRSLIPIVEELIRIGHNVTVISKYPLADVQHSKHNFVELTINYCQSKDTGDIVQSLSRNDRFTNLVGVFNFYHQYSEELLNLPELQRIIHSQDQYDLVIAELFYLDVFLTFGYKFKAPVVALSPMNLKPIYCWILGNPHPSSYFPNQLLPYTENMSLLSRISNTIFNVFSVLFYELVHLPKTQKQMEKYFDFSGKHIPSIKDIVRNVSLVLVNTHYSISYIKPELPNFVNIAGVHHPSLKPLSEKMQTFMEEANFGVIYVSFGSVIEPRYFMDIGNEIVRELKNFPQRVIMKWDPQLLAEIPENFLVEKWIPQTQVLNHPNCHLFLTHGGLHSTLESVNASVPILGIPLLSDQYYNMAAAEYFGIGKSIPFDEVSVRLAAEVKEVLNNPKYKQNIMKRSQLFRGRLVKPLDEAIYWVEHVMKHKTSPHLKSYAVQLTWYEFYGVDVLVILLAVTFSTILVMKLLIVFIMKKFSEKIRNLYPGVNQKSIKKDQKVE